MKKIGLVMSACLMGMMAQAQLIDDFSDTSLAEYTLSRINDANGTAHISFASPSGNLRGAYTGTPNAFEQVLFLRNDYSLAVGQMLIADVLGTGVGWDRDIGIAVGYSATPPALAGGASGDVRTSYVEVAFRSNNQVVSFARNGVLNLASGQEFAGTTYGGTSFSGYVDSIFITRPSATEFQVGWMEGSAIHYLTPNGGATLLYNVTTDTPGAAVGFYADLRAAISESPTGLDNLRIAPIPEPSMAALMGLGLVGFIGRLRRRA